MKSIYPNLAFQPPLHPTRSAHVLGFWSKKQVVNDHDSVPFCSDGSQANPMLYKHINGEEDDSYTLGQPVNVINETISITKNATSSPKRSRLVSSLRSLRPLIVPPWMLPFLSSYKAEDINLVQGDNDTSITSSTLVLTPPSFSEGTDRCDVQIELAMETSDSSNELTIPIHFNNSVIDAEIEPDKQDPEHTAMQPKGNGFRRRFFRRQERNNTKPKHSKPTLSKEEAACPIVVSNIHELREAVLINKIPLRDVGFRFPVYGIGSEIIPKPSALNNATTQTGISLYRGDFVSSDEEESPKAKSESFFQRHGMSTTIRNNETTTL
jgi:hypothetical protein